MAATYEAFVRLGNENGVTNVTREEFTQFVESKVWSNQRALLMIKNSRKRKETEANKQITIHIGYPLGGRDFVYKGITVEAAKSQLIPFLLPDGQIIELTQFGSYKGKHLYKSEVEVEISTKKGNERTYTNHVIQAVKVLDDKMDIKRLMAKSVQIDDLKEDMLYQNVIFLGEIENFDLESRFEKGEKVGSYPLIHNEQPCFNIIFKKQKRYVRAACSLTNNSEHILDMPDLMDVLKSVNNDVVQLSDAYRGEWAVVVGVIKRFDFTENADFINIDATAIMVLPDALREHMIAQSQAVGSPSIEATAVKTDVVKPAPLPAKNATFDVAKANQEITALKAKIQEGRELLGDDLTIQALREMGLISSSVPDVIIEKLMKE